jgi:hypothetical protein
VIYCGNKRVIAYSFFKEDITPEWEHPTNIVGCEWGCRESMPSDLFSYMFNHLSLCAINNELEDVVGIRCINKCNKVRLLYKIEIWMQDKKHAETIHEYLQAIIQEYNNTFEQSCTLNFTLLYHKEKQHKANEFCKKKHQQIKKKENKVRL